MEQQRAQPDAVAVCPHSVKLTTLGPVQLGVGATGAGICTDESPTVCKHALELCNLVPIRTRFICRLERRDLLGI